jgi:hypothetical protein
MSKINRDGFTTIFGVLVATLGSAIGLGNIWKFPSLTGTNGGASFLLVYLAATLLVGLPVMIAETMLGRAARANAVTNFEILAPRGQSWWKAIGWMGFAAALLIMAFYSEVAGWVYAYIFKAVSGEVSTTDPKVAGAAFGQLVSSPLTVLAWQWVVLALTGGIIMSHRRTPSTPAKSSSTGATHEPDRRGSSPAMTWRGRREPRTPLRALRSLPFPPAPLRAIRASPAGPRRVLRRLWPGRRG